MPSIGGDVFVPTKAVSEALTTDNYEFGDKIPDIIAGKKQKDGKESSKGMGNTEHEGQEGIHRL